MNKLPNTENPTHQDEDVQQPLESEPSPIYGRREFLAVASKFSAIVAILGISSDVLAEKVLNPKKVHNPKNVVISKGNSKSVAELLRNAIQTGDMDATLKKYKDQVRLSEKQLKALRSLSRQDLQLLNSIKTKLAPLRGKVDGGDRVLY